MDTRGDGGYILLPPSNHQSGKRYEWSNKAQMAEAPEWLLERLTKQKPEIAPPPKTSPGGSAYARKALEAELAELEGATEGSRNHRLNQAAYSLGQLVAGDELERGEVESALLSAALGIGLSEVEARKTISSGLAAGKTAPRTAPDCKLTTPQTRNTDNNHNAASRSVPRLSEDALPGVLADFVQVAAKNSEADPPAILSTFFAFFAANIGNSAYFKIADTRHYARTNTVIVGDSNIGRKGTSAGPTKAIFEHLDKGLTCRTSPGPLSSGEGIVYAVRDETHEWKIDKKAGTGEWVVTDPGIEDKRLLVFEEEFAGLLKAGQREGNTSSAVIRTLWDSGNCEPITKSNRIKCTDAHVCILAHITSYELGRLLSENDRLNGFGNRFLWVHSRRSKLVPFPQPLPEAIAVKMAEQVKDAMQQAQGLYEMSASARDLWMDVYPDLSEPRPGMAGVMVGRAAPYVLRLAFTYCLFRCGTHIEAEDLNAALAFWKYCDESAASIFGGEAPPDRKRQKIMSCLTDGPKTRTKIIDQAFQRHIKSDTLDALLEALLADGFIVSETEQTAGRPRTLYKKTVCEKSEESEESQGSTPLNSLNSLNSQQVSENEQLYPTFTEADFFFDEREAT